MDAEVLIIGAGATGLSLARGLKMAGITCKVFEQDDSISSRSRDWNMGLHWGAPILRSLIGDDAWSRIQSVQVDSNTPTKHLDGLKFLNGATGDLAFEATIDYFYRLKRSALRAFLAERVNIEFGKRSIDIEVSDNGDSLTVKFADRTSATGNLIVGCDGPRSKVREFLFGEASIPQRLPYGATFIHATYTREQALFLRSFHPLYLAACHPNDQFAFFGLQDASDAEKPETWTFFFYISFNSSLKEQEQTASWTPTQRLAQAKELAKNYCDPWKSAYEWLPDDHPAWYFGFSDWDPASHKWDNKNGRVTLAGDAAHIMTVQRGQGLNHSVTDAAKLLDTIKKGRQSGESSLSEDINAYEEEMIRRAGEEIRLCTKNTAMLHGWEQFKQSPLFKKGLQKE